MWQKLAKRKKIEYISEKDLKMKPFLKELRKEEIERIGKFEHNKNKYGHSYATYVSIQRIVSLLGEFFLDELHCSALYELLREAEQEYVPGWPPMSPLSTSYFAYWALFDARYRENETFAEYILRSEPMVKMLQDQVVNIKMISASRMGIYVNMGQESKSTLKLRELLTNREFSVALSSGYIGTVGDICYLRILPPLIERDSYVAVTSPYILRGHSEKEWLEFLLRQGIDSGDAQMHDKLHAFFKYGPNVNYWNEFIFLSYRGYENSHIYLQGVPDIASTKPHEDLMCKEFSQISFSH